MLLGSGYAVGWHGTMSREGLQALKIARTAATSQEGLAQYTEGSKGTANFEFEHHFSGCQFASSILLNCFL